MLELKQFPERLKRALFRSARVMRLKRSTAYVLWELIDNPNSRAWSNDRIAKATGFSIRTVELALAELRAHGFISMRYRRQMTALKTICVEAVLDAVKNGVEAAKRACAARIALIRKGFQDPQRTAANIHSLFKNVADCAPWRVQNAPSASLLRVMGLAVDPKRR